MKYTFPFLLLFFLSCSSRQDWDVEQATDAIFAPDELQYRRFEIGMTKPDFDAAYTGDAIYGNEMEVIDSLTLSEGVYCETAFRFKEGTLAEISVQIIIDDEEKKKDLYKAIESKLKKDYGEGLKDKDQYYWRAEGGLVTTDIYLMDYSAGTMKKKDSRFVISLYYTAGTLLS
jgi:hypothetical protein